MGHYLRLIFPAYGPAYAALCAKMGHLIAMFDVIAITGYAVTRLSLSEVTKVNDISEDLLTI
jgi:hypothetical protein